MTSWPDYRTVRQSAATARHGHVGESRTIVSRAGPVPWRTHDFPRRPLRIPCRGRGSEVARRGGGGARVGAGNRPRRTNSISNTLNTERAENTEITDKIEKHCSSYPCSRRCRCRFGWVSPFAASQRWRSVICRKNPRIVTWQTAVSRARTALPSVCSPPAPHDRGRCGLLGGRPVVQAGCGPEAAPASPLAVRRSTP